MSETTPARDRPATTPTALVCEECGARFHGEPYNLFCGVCVAAIAWSIAEAQGNA